MKRTIIFLVSLFLLNSCVPHVSMLPYDKNSKTVQKGYLVALPQTVLQVQVDYCESNFLKGPYAEYSEKYLGIKNISLHNSKSIYVSDIRISSHQEADPLAYYFVNFSRCFSLEEISRLAKKGMLFDPLNEEYKPITAMIQTENSNQHLTFSDLSTKNFYENKSDTLYKVVLRDSVFVKIPVLKNSIQNKSFEDKAREAADLIIKIRARRLELLTPEEETTGDKGLEASLKNLDQLEARYLKLFIGTTENNHFYKLYNVIPTFNNNNVCVHQIDSISNDKLWVKISKLSDSTSNFYLQSISKNGIICKIPAKTNVEILFNDAVVAQSYLFLSQAGSRILVPAKSMHRYRK